MEAQIQPIKEYVYPHIGIYTVKFDGNVLNEYDDFNKRWADTIKRSPDDYWRYVKDFQIIRSTIKGLQYRGVRPEFFKMEALKDTVSRAIALPTYYKHRKTEELETYGIRLYGFLVSSKILFLLNGNNKSELSPRYCANCRKYFFEANNLSIAMEQAIEKGLIKIRGKNLQYNNQFKLKI